MTNTNIVPNELEAEEKIMEGVEELVEEPKELTEEEKHAKFIEAVKNSHLNYKPKKVFGTAYKKKRQKKNKLVKASRRANRK